MQKRHPPPWSSEWHWAPLPPPQQQTAQGLGCDTPEKINQEREQEAVPSLSVLGASLALWAGLGSGFLLVLSQYQCPCPGCGQPEPGQRALQWRAPASGWGTHHLPALFPGHTLSPALQNPSTCPCPLPKFEALLNGQGRVGCPPQPTRPAAPVFTQEPLLSASAIRGTHHLQMEEKPRAESTPCWPVSTSVPQSTRGHCPRLAPTPATTQAGLDQALLPAWLASSPLPAPRRSHRSLHQAQETPSQVAVTGEPSHVPWGFHGRGAARLPTPQRETQTPPVPGHLVMWSGSTCGGPRGRARALGRPGSSLLRARAPRLRPRASTAPM